MEAKAKIVEEYIDSRGKNPFRIWLKSLRNKKTQAVVDARITRIRKGNFGNCRSVDHGVNEFKIDYGSGYRVYFGQEGNMWLFLWRGQGAFFDSFKGCG